MTMLSEKWNSFMLRVGIRATEVDVYKAWTTQDGLERWFLRSAEFTDQHGRSRHIHDFVQPNDFYHWLWHGYPDDVFERNEVIDANGRNTFKFVFTGNCVVTVTLSHAFGETICTLTQEHIPLDVEPKTNLYLNCSNGWTFYLTNLKSILEGGLDLRNKNINLSHVINS